MNKEVIKEINLINNINKLLKNINEFNKIHTDNQKLTNNETFNYQMMIKLSEIHCLLIEYREIIKNKKSYKENINKEITIDDLFNLDLFK